MARQPVKKTRVNIYLPESLVSKLDDDANSLGLSRGAVICMYLVRHYENQQTSALLQKGMDMIEKNMSDKVPNEAVQLALQNFSLG